MSTEESSPTATLNEPLLRPTESRTPPRHAFQIRNRTETEEQAEAVEGPTTRSVESSPAPDPEIAIQRQLLQVFGTPFASSSTFWCQSLPMAAILGVVIGLASLAFLVATQLALQQQWHHIKGNYHWLIVTTVGGFLSGLVFCLAPNSPPLGAVRTFFHDAADIQGQDCVAIVLAGAIALATGAPVGPEQALGSLGSGISSRIAQFLRVSRRMEASWILTGLSASLGGIFPSPLLGPTLVHELSVTGRPDRLTLNAVVASEVQEQAEEADENIAVVVDSSHDYMENMVLQVVSSTAAGLLIRTIFPSILHLSDLAPIPHDEFQVWHLAAAVPIGLLCAMCGSLVVVFNAAFRRIRACLTQFLTRLNLPSWFATLFFPTLAGLLHGIIAVHHPYTAGSGLPFLRSAWNQAMDGEAILSTRSLIWMAFWKVFGLGASVGFGLVGGPVIPTVVAGLCIGLALASSISLLPLSLTVPCCLVACPGAFCPIPLTGIFTVTLALGCSAEQTGPILIAVVTSWTFTGGVGTLRRLGENRLSSVEESDESENLDNSAPTDDEILRDVRSAIFGSV